MASFILFAIYLLTINVNCFGSTDSEYDEGTEPTEAISKSIDKIVLLTADNFDENIYNSTTAWLVRFYDSRYDPEITIFKSYSTLWKQLAYSIYNWQDVLQLGALDCAADHDKNTQFCLEYKSRPNYPTIRYFPPYLKSFDSGDVINVPSTRDTSDPAEWRIEIIKRLQTTKKKPFFWPDFTSLSSEEAIESIWKANNGHLLVLVVEDHDSYVGSALIMDLYGAPVVVRYTNNKNFAANSKEELPQVLVVRPDALNSRKRVRLNDTTREGVYEAVRNHLQNEGYVLPDIKLETKLDVFDFVDPEMFFKAFEECEKLLAAEVLTKATKQRTYSYVDQINRNKCTNFTQAISLFSGYLLFE